MAVLPFFCRPLFNGLRNRSSAENVADARRNLTAVAHEIVSLSCNSAALFDRRYSSPAKWKSRKRFGLGVGTSVHQGEAWWKMDTPSSSGPASAGFLTIVSFYT
jgi:hypothetical protein